jgi:hypothetical protein
MIPFLAVDQDRVRKAELADAAGDLRDLRIAVRPRVAHVRDQSLDRAHDAARLAGCGRIDATTLVPPGCSAQLDDFDNIVIRAARCATHRAGSSPRA